MENASETIAKRLVEDWMQENKLYLLDGDMRILHPIAREALISRIVKELNVNGQAEIASDGKAKARKKAKD